MNSELMPICPEYMVAIVGGHVCVWKGRIMQERGDAHVERHRGAVIET